jgi:hypothetical protein
VVRVEPFDFQAGIRTYRLPESQDVTARQVGAYKDVLRDAGIITLDWAVGSRPRELLEVMRFASP